jgi:hypothetical protein
LHQISHRVGVGVGVGVTSATEWGWGWGWGWGWDTLPVYTSFLLVFDYS